MTTLGVVEVATAVAVVAVATGRRALPHGPSARRPGRSPGRDRAWSNGPGSRWVGRVSNPAAATGHRAVRTAPAGRRARSRRPADARWASRSALRPITVDGHRSGRLTIGTAEGPRRLGQRVILAAEPAQSVAVVGPTQSGKTTGLAVPAILGWDGPVVAASVKTDLVADTVAWRRQCGRVWCFDPGRTTGLPGCSWSPLVAARTWPGARRVAADLTEVARGAGTTADGEFWYATAANSVNKKRARTDRGGGTIHYACCANRLLLVGIKWPDTRQLCACEGTLGTQCSNITCVTENHPRSSVASVAHPSFRNVPTAQAGC